ncbi:MAG: TadE/TadG family type IV pilus assembly protein [Acidimicrobiales bacterium]
MIGVDDDVMSAERGAALVETALMAPFLLLLTLGVVEVGVAWQKQTTVQYASRAAAVAGFAAGNTPDHDAQMIQALMRDLRGRGVDEVDWMVVFDADRYDEVPVRCLTPEAMRDGGVDGVCVTYPTSVVDEVAAGGATFSGSCSNRPDRRWCATDRLKSRGWKVGVGFSATEQSLTRFVPGFDQYTVADTVIIKEQARHG